MSGVDHTFSIDIMTRNEDSNSVLMLTPHLAEYSTELNANSPMIVEKPRQEKVRINDLIPEFRDCEDIFN